MKKFIVLAVLSVFTAFSANAQYRGSHRGVSPSYQRSAPSRSYRGWGARDYGYNRPYVGLRVGASFSNITGDACSGGNMKTGVNTGLAFGFPLSGYMPLYLETGIYYNEKGEGSNGTYKYNVNYLELPFVFKYQHYITNHTAIQPYFGGFASLGIAGKTTAVGSDNKSQHGSFGDQGDFKRGDAGLRVGCGLSFDMLYAEVNYDLGLANIVKNTSPLNGEGKNSSLTLNVGINF